MSLSLSNIQPSKGSKHRRMRVGRGLARKGTYSGRGVKGQRARSGGSHGLQLKGLRHIMLGMPKARGFKSLAPKLAVVNLDSLSRNFLAGEEVTPEALLAKGLIDDKDNGVKVLGTGDLKVKLTFKGLKMSKTAVDKITAAGGTIVE